MAYFLWSCEDKSNTSNVSLRVSFELLFDWSDWLILRRSNQANVKLDMLILSIMCLAIKLFQLPRSYISLFVCFIYYELLLLFPSFYSSSSHPIPRIHLSHINILLLYIHESSLWYSSFPPVWKLHIQYPLSSISTIHPLYLWAC